MAFFTMHTVVLSTEFHTAMVTLLETTAASAHSESTNCTCALRLGGRGPGPKGHWIRFKKAKIKSYKTKSIFKHLEKQNEYDLKYEKPESLNLYQYSFLYVSLPSCFAHLINSSKINPYNQQTSHYHHIL